MQKQKVYTIIKYTGWLTFYAVLLLSVTLLMGYLDEERSELLDCFSVKGSTIKAVPFCTRELFALSSQKVTCTCICGEFCLTVFYILALPIFFLNEFMRRKIISSRFAYPLVLFEIGLWTFLYQLLFLYSPERWFAWRVIYWFFSPLAIIMLALHILPYKALKIATWLMIFAYIGYIILWFSLPQFFVNFLIS